MHISMHKVLHQKIIDFRYVPNNLNCSEKWQFFPQNVELHFFCFTNLIFFCRKKENLFVVGTMLSMFIDSVEKRRAEEKIDYKS